MNISISAVFEGSLPASAQDRSQPNMAGGGGKKIFVGSNIYHLF